MTIYVMRNGRLVKKSLAAFACVPCVISDSMDMLKHPGTGAMIDSKSRFREHTRASGCVEVGTDPAGAREKPRYEPSVLEIVHDVKRAIAELRSR
jgi:hypothetical protein